MQAARIPEQAMTQAHISTDVVDGQVAESLALDLDLAALAAAFGQRLHAAGMTVTPDQSQRFALSLQLVKPSTLRRLYYTARSTFQSDPDELDLFDRVFGEVFDPAGRQTAAYVHPDMRFVVGAAA